MDKQNKFKLSSLQFLLIIAGFIWLIVLGGTVYNFPDIQKTGEEDIRKVINHDTLTVPDIELNKGKIIPGVKISDILSPNVKLLALGATEFKSSCASCHGNDGKGDGPAGTMLTPKPRNFHQKDGWKNGREISSMFKTVAEGIPGSGMSAYEFLPVETRFAIIYYIRSLTKDFPPVTQDEIVKIDQIYDITKDKNGGAAIPVQLAKQKIIQQHNASIDKLLIKIENSGNVVLALFNTITTDKRKALQTLCDSPEWQHGAQSFVKIITANTGTNGFKADANRLTAEQARELQVFLKDIFANG